MRVRHGTMAAAMLALAAGACSGDDEDDATSGAAERLGTACEQGSSCGDGLTCHSDTLDYLSHGQCTKECVSSEDCVAALGASAMCIGAGICVRKCETQNDCPAKTVCGIGGWCARTGPGSGNPYCGGSATPCSLLTEDECWKALGCSLDGSCSGVAPSCYDQATQYMCTTVEGCSWSTYGESCSGSSTACYQMTASYECVGQVGCTWTESCSGVPMRTCGELMVSQCEGTPGCAIVY